MVDIYAARDMKAGTEVAFDYGSEFFKGASGIEEDE
jgi:hypothetical protein